MGSASKQSKQSANRQGRPGGRADQAADRRARIAELRAAEERRDKRNKFIAISLATVLIGGMVAVGGWIALDAKQKRDDKKAAAAAADKARKDAANAPIDGVQTFDNLTRNHVSTKVTYQQTPPVGGDHNPVWLTCMGNVYDQPVQNENAVHSLEHGAVWVTYNAKATPDDIKALSEKVKVTPYSFMSPYPDEAGTITLNAWGTQLKVDSATDPRVEQFFTKYVQGPQTQEPGASCSNGAMK
ncbi:DUF3105 domain-containing protein [Kitasatospora sp. NPDC048540]|uniref:DUF3105 domain-containing protein n=1 Tax=unclassified Kitasatospora TaxID=2633591 RepID=UPI0005399E0E|nr:DUF3105 domain-containing protein [Kitasatospora sp. MBT63]